jgi:hypothetical protein
MTPFEQYCKTYKDRLEKFLNKNPDAEEIDFINKEKMSVQAKF